MGALAIFSGPTVEQEAYYQNIFDCRELLEHFRAMRINVALVFPLSTYKGE